MCSLEISRHRGLPFCRQDICDHWITRKHVYEWGEGLEKSSPYVYVRHAGVYQTFKKWGFSNHDKLPEKS